MRTVVITLVMILCVMAAGTRHGASTREGYIPPLDPERTTSCKDPALKPATGIAYARPAAAQPWSPAASAATTAPAALSNSVFEKFVRCPFGDPLNINCSNISLWKHADDRIAYYRDVIFAGSTFISNATDGETWSASFVRPDGSTLDFSTVTYTEADNCFNFPGQPKVCGSSSIRIYWYFDSQCAQTGLWRFKPSHNGAAFADEQFRIKPRLGTQDELADKLVPFSQADPAWADEPYADICHPPDADIIMSCDSDPGDWVRWTIGEQGCGVTALATVLRYHGVDTNPKKLNDWLLANDYYSSLGNMRDDEAPVLYAEQLGVTLNLVGVFPGNVEGRSSIADISGQVCRYGPVHVRVRGDDHSVVALGRDDGLTTLSILDVLDGDAEETLSNAYNNRFDSFVVYRGAGQEFIDNRSRVSIKFFSPVAAFVVDPLGRRQGLDPRTGTSYNEIPGAFYGGVSIIGPNLPEDYESPKLLDLPRPAEGAYTLTVVGTGEGTYDADFVMYDSAHGRSQQHYAGIATAPGAVHTYRFEVSQAPGSRLVTAGGFDGGGQRPRDVNKFLSYAQPSAASTALAAGATSYQLLVFYGAGVIPSTFRAQLNGADVAPLFGPSPGGSQAVTLPLQRGRNVLQLSVDGSLPSRVATDSDRLVFEVP